MMKWYKANECSRNRSEGSSLAIALFFFLVCSLLCAGVLYLANSSTSWISKNYNYAKEQTYSAGPLPEPTTTTEPTPPPEHDSKYKNDCEAIDLVFDKLNYDFYRGFVSADGGTNYYIYGADNKDPITAPQNLSYEILSYIHAKIGNPTLVPRNADGNVEVSFKVSLNGYPPIKITVLITGFETSNMENKGKESNHTGLDFDSFTITVASLNHPDCTYKKQLNYSVQEGKLYIRWSSGTNNGKYFVIKNTP